MRSAHHYTSKQLFAVFWPYLRPHRGRIALAILALALIASALLGMGRGLAYLVDEGLGKRDPVLLDRAVMATVFLPFVDKTEITVNFDTFCSTFFVAITKVKKLSVFC